MKQWRTNHEDSGRDRPHGNIFTYVGISDLQ